MKKRQQKLMNAILGYAIVLVCIGALILTFYSIFYEHSPRDYGSVIFGIAVVISVGYYISRSETFQFDRLIPH